MGKTLGVENVSVRAKRLAETYEDLTELQQASGGILTFEIDGSPPDKFNEVILRLRGLQSVAKLDDRGMPVFRTDHELSIDFTGFPVREPKIVFRSPIFHPNVWPSRLVCIDWDASLPAFEVFVGLVNMIQYYSQHHVNPKSAANIKAAEWAERNPWVFQNTSRFPKVKFPPLLRKIGRVKTSDAVDWGT